MRKLNIGLKPSAGAITRFYAFVDDKQVIADDGNQTPKWNGSVNDTNARVKVRVSGIGEATYKFTISLEGVMDGQVLELSLNGGYGEFEFIL